MAVAIAGVVCAALLDRAGHRMAGLLTCALTGLLCSPISWDHHWVWIVPGAVVAAVYAVRARRGLALDPGWPGRGPDRWCSGRGRGACGACPANTGGYFEGLIWVPPLTNPELYLRLGDQPWFAEYHWHGLQLITGNLYVLTGMALFGLLLVAGFGPPVRAGLAVAIQGRAYARNGCPRPLMATGGSIFHRSVRHSQTSAAAAASSTTGAH